MKYRNRRPFSESGFTLQTLIITAVVVVLAIGVGLLFLALTSSSSGNLEDAGRSGSEAACAPNELLDAVYVRHAFGGPEGRGGVRSKSVGCKPYCATWEFLAMPSAGGEYRLGGTGEGSPIGGPDGAGGVFSSKIGCFAPCYWEVGEQDSARLRPRELIGTNIDRDLASTADPQKTELGYVEDARENDASRLRYHNDNRPPDAGVIRLGVTYRRILDTSEENFFDAYGGTELQGTAGRNRDGKPYFYVSPKPAHSVSGRYGHDAGVRNAPGTPLSPEQIAQGVPTVHEPNWYSPGYDYLGSREWGRFNTYWEDEDWEVRADPENEVCEIVYTPTDRLVCSSDNDSCLESNYPDNCPPMLEGRLHVHAGKSDCRLP